MFIFISLKEIRTRRQKSRTPYKWNMNANAQLKQNARALASDRSHTIFLPISRMPVNIVRFINLAKQDWTIYIYIVIHFGCNGLFHFFFYSWFVGFVCFIHCIYMWQSIKRAVNGCLFHIDLEHCSKFYILPGIDIAIFFSSLSFKPNHDLACRIWKKKRIKFQMVIWKCHMESSIISNEDTRTHFKWS